MCKPTLTAGNVTPSQGSTSTIYTYLVNYTDADNDKPTVIYIIINGIPYNMTKQDLSDNIFTDGCLFYYTTTLSKGNHTFHFEASDGIYFIRTPSVGEITEPIVSEDKYRAYAEGNDDGKDDNGKTSAIPGYNIFILISALCIISIMLIKRRRS